jgi:ribonucleotide reductase alpha subunit
MKISKEKLIERFKAIVKFERDIKNEYDEFIEQVHDQIVVEKMKAIRDWEIRHIQLAQELVDAIQKVK